jgi:hypothetical protein
MELTLPSLVEAHPLTKIVLTAIKAIRKAIRDAFIDCTACRD